MTFLVRSAGGLNVSETLPNTPRKATVNTIYDLAEQTGLAASTISRVLNQRGRISLETRKRVIAAAREAGFKPRMSARQTAVAVVLDRMRYSTYGGFIASLLTHLIEQIAGEDLAIEVYTEDNVSRLGSRFIDAIVALSWDRTTIDQLSKLSDLPIVVINRMDLPEFSAVASDHHQGGRLVGEYLVKHGHTRIAFLGEEQDWGALQRLAGMREAIESGGGSFDEGLAAFTKHEPVYGALRRLLARKPTALFLAGEDLALEGTFILTDMLGVRAPKDLSLVGIENARVSHFTRPPLTTLCQPLERIAQDAIGVIVNQLASEDTTPQQALLQNTIIERESVASV